MGSRARPVAIWTLVSQKAQLGRQRFEHEWHSHRLSHRGRYSIERMQALDDYCQTGSRLRIWTVFLVLPFPPLAITILNKCIPLQNPSNGWRANLASGCVLLLDSRLYQLDSCSNQRNGVGLEPDCVADILYCFLSTSITLALEISIAASWAFPIPFGLVISCSAFTTILVVLLLIVMGRAQCNTNPV